ncbi:hypothetical protein GOP47_0003311 [Adiantum capillus-veneris]|uniref:Uncharacterized protein n=1 Tax=Adiantum capillus-veneris TaxID=13818 RepID=A0A9D4VDI4_ADICA|nr:hypothetical protein GOP47_0003311 [Adiantum capillus-veneris]
MAMAMHHQLVACGIVSPSWPSSPACRLDFGKSDLRHVFRLASSSAGDAATEVGKDEDEEDADSQSGSDDSFEERLAKLRRRANRGTGTKAEKRKARKAGDYVSLSSAPSKEKGADKVLLPPVPLKDPVSDGLLIELGFNSYTERINGRFAALGLAAFLLVELASGSSFLKYHESSVIGLQAYFMLSVAAIFIKYEKEKISIWPASKS